MKNMEKVKKAKKVINGIYETSKMIVTIKDDSVTKVFKVKYGSKFRYTKEKKSLQRLSGVVYFPELLEFDDAKQSLKMSRLTGNHPPSLSETQIQRLKEMVEIMLGKGVARHSLPIRDLLSDNEQDIFMVDFERTSIRLFHWSPAWWIAKQVSHYNLICLIREYQPHLLTASDKKLLSRYDKVHDISDKLRPAKLGIKKLKKKLYEFYS